MHHIWCWSLEIWFVSSPSTQVTIWDSTQGCDFHTHFPHSPQIVNWNSTQGCVSNTPFQIPHKQLMCWFGHLALLLRIHCKENRAVLIRYNNEACLLPISMMVTTNSIQGLVNQTQHFTFPKGVNSKLHTCLCAWGCPNSQQASVVCIHHVWNTEAVEWVSTSFKARRSVISRTTQVHFQHLMHRIWCGFLWIWFVLHLPHK